MKTLTVCHAKFKPHDAIEQNFLDTMIVRITELVEKHNLPHTHLRFGRQVKAYGSTGVSDYNTYTYHSGKIEFWVNAHNTTMDAEGIRYLEWALVKGTFYKLDKVEQKNYMDDADITAYCIKHNVQYKLNKNLRMYFGARAYADSILGFNYRLDARG
jgi:hypothetical protein